jgi:hypothetical protein
VPIACDADEPSKDREDKMPVGEIVNMVGIICYFVNLFGSDSPVGDRDPVAEDAKENSSRTTALVAFPAPGVRFDFESSLA